jgi:hypothetical protein
MHELSLLSDFTELRTVTADQLMYVKEDLILPQTNTFYDFIVTKVRISSIVDVKKESGLFINAGFGKFF